MILITLQGKNHHFSQHFCFFPPFCPSIFLGHLLYHAIELRGGGLVETGGLLQPHGADRLEQSQGAHAIRLRGVFGFLEGDLHVT